VTPTPTATKDPDATERFGVDWAARLAVDGATLASVAWLATPPGLTLSGATNDTTSASTLVAGGVLGVTYALTCRATCSDGQVLDASQQILVQQT
jgi:hypothetical protein